LNYDVEGSKSYDVIYGRLYNWETAKNVCPTGWHLPSDADWDVLVNHAGGSNIAGTKLRSTTGWGSLSILNGTDDYEFSALPGGIYSGGTFREVGGSGFFWSATEGSNGSAWSRDIYGSNVSRASEDKSKLLSVRCVKN